MYFDSLTAQPCLITSIHPILSNLHTQIVRLKRSIIMSGSSSKTERLIALVQSLPQELIDAIIAYTFTPSKRQIEISAGYSPPALLSVNSGTRRVFAKNFYSKTIFHSRSEDLLARWLISMPAAHRALLKRVRLVRRPEGKGEGPKGSLRDEKKECAAVRERMASKLMAAGAEVDDSSVFTTVWTDER